MVDIECFRWWLRPLHVSSDVAVPACRVYVLVDLSVCGYLTQRFVINPTPHLVPEGRPYEQR